MKKLMASFILGFMVLSMLAGCTSSAPNTSSSPTPAQESGSASTPATETPPATPAAPSGITVTSTEKISWKMNTTTADDTAWTMGAVYLADMVREMTGGNFDITVYSNESLSGGNQLKGVENVMAGIVEMDCHSNGVYISIDPKYCTISLPFMYESAEEAYAVLDGPAGQFYNDLLDANNLVLLGFGENGMRQMTSNKPVNSLQDMNGLKFRVPNSNMYLNSFTAMGCNPIAMNFAEVFTSLQQGTIDGQENPFDVIEGNLIYEVQDYLIMSNWSYDCLFYVVNKDKFNSLPADYQAVLVEAGKQAAQYQVELNRSRQERQLDFFKQHMEVIYWDDDTLQSFKDVTVPVMEEYREIIGAENVALFAKK